MSEDESNYSSESENNYSSGSENNYSSGSENEEEEILDQLKDVPFETLLKLQKKSQERLASETRIPSARAKAEMSSKTAKRKANDAPAEMSSKIPVSRYRQVVAPVQKAPARDPRFDSLSGVYNAGLYKKAYGFLDDMRAEEIDNLKTSIRNLEKYKDARGGMYREELEKEKRALNVLEEQNRVAAEREKQQAIKREWRKGMAERIKVGKNPYFMKRKDEKRLRAVKRFNELKEKGGSSAVDAAIKKRTKKMSEKSMRSMPSIRERKY